MLVAPMPVVTLCSGHAKQSALDVAPAVPLKVLMGHTRHGCASAFSLYEPGGHSVQTWHAVMRRTAFQDEHVAGSPPLRPVHGRDHTICSVADQPWRAILALVCIWVQNVLRFRVAWPALLQLVKELAPGCAVGRIDEGEPSRAAEEQEEPVLALHPLSNGNICCVLTVTPDRIRCECAALVTNPSNRALGAHAVDAIHRQIESVRTLAIGGVCAACHRCGSEGGARCAVRQCRSSHRRPEGVERAHRTVVGRNRVLVRPSSAGRAHMAYCQL
eukprot:271134-Rhodomonas_salina.2